MSQRKSNHRRGIIMPLLAIGIVALLGLVALAVDLGRLSLAQSECQAAADSAAIAAREVWTVPKIFPLRPPLPQLLQPAIKYWGRRFLLRKWLSTTDHTTMILRLRNSRRRFQLYHRTITTSPGS